MRFAQMACDFKNNKNKNNKSKNKKERTRTTTTTTTAKVLKSWKTVPRQQQQLPNCSVSTWSRNFLFYLIIQSHDVLYFGDVVVHQIPDAFL